MAGRAAWGVVGRWTAVVLLMLSGWGCTAPAEGADRTARETAREITATLDRRAAAVMDRDERAYLAVIDPSVTALRAAGRREFGNLAEVPLGSWTYRLTDVERSGDRATVRAELRHRIAGYDSAPVSEPRTLELRERAGQWYVTADRPGEGSGAQQLWQQGPVRAVRGARSLVLGVGQDDARLRAIADAADAAVPAVTDAWPGGWARREVLLVPASSEAMARLLGASKDAYRDIAAVTTGISADGTGTQGASPADRVVVNPTAYDTLGAFGQHIVLTHETTHVATRAATSSATPLWLSEGFADWAAYRGTDRTAEQIAPELQRAVRGGDTPAALPSDEDFAFGAGADRLAGAYEGGWLACELIAGRWGERKLTDFYRAVGAHDGRDGAVEDALHTVLATTPEDFTARWRDYLRQRLG